MRLRIFQNQNLFKCLGLLIFLLIGTVTGLKAYEMKNRQDVSSRKPVNISAIQLIFDRLKGLTIFTGNVHAIHDKVVLTAQSIQALEDYEEATAKGHVKVVDNSESMTLTCGNLEYQDLMELMTAHDHPLLVTLDEKGNPVSVEGRQMELDSVKKSVVVNQNVQNPSSQWPC